MMENELSDYTVEMIKEEFEKNGRSVIRTLKSLNVSKAKENRDKLLEIIK